MFEIKKIRFFPRSFRELEAGSLERAHLPRPRCGFMLSDRSHELGFRWDSPCNLRTFPKRERVQWVSDRHLDGTKPAMLHAEPVEFLGPDLPEILTMRPTLRLAGMLSVAVLLTGCASSGNNFALNATDVALLSPDEMVLQPGDVLRVSVWPEQDLSGDFVVEESGYVYLPYLESVLAGGVSIGEIRAQLRRGYQETMRNPVVTITPIFRVSVMGEVQRPGIYDITPASSLFDVLGEAGGFRPDADQERLRIVRPGQVIEYDALRALERGQDLNLVQLRSGDQIIIPAADPPTDWRSVLNIFQSASTLILIWDRLKN